MGRAKKKKRRSTKTAHGRTAAEKATYKRYKAAKRKLISEYFGAQGRLF